ncbi:MAG: serine/threonine-protein kinase [Nannocystaceae bacterium]|nr:serine/threonine-protein kinase [Nannocystaceae bacterium]
MTSQSDGAGASHTAATQVDGAAATPWLRTEAPPGPAPGDRIGRYVVVETLGRGGMGVVLRAYDPRLQREVALKLLHEGGDADARARMVREAQAMARLSHPNIVRVHDVDVVDGQPFIAMDLVEGESLHEWLVAQPRAPAEVIAAFRDAGAGLAAAHAAGLVHRDIKPRNLLRDRDGRVRVTDFGIARSRDDAQPRRADDHGGVDAEHTAAGVIVGTLPYMAPEQHEGATADARSDQFAFCVALWEALAGTRPFAGEDTRTLLAAKRARQLQPLPPTRTIGPQLRAVLRRGLQPEPRDRFDDMNALVRAMERAQAGARRRARLRWWIAAAGVAGAVWLAMRVRDRSLRDDCEQRAAQQDPWSQARGEGIREAWRATGLDYAAATAERVVPRLAEYAATLRESTAALCVAHELEHTLGEPLASAGQWCLDETRGQLVAVLERLERAEPLAVQRALLAVSELPQAEGCLEPARLQQFGAPPPDQRDAIAIARSELATARASMAAGDFVAARDGAARVVEHARGLSWPPLQAQAELLLGHATTEFGDAPAAEEALRGAYDTAAAAGLHELAFKAAVSLATVAARVPRHGASASIWARVAANERTRLPDDSGLREAEVELARADVATAAGDVASARLHDQRALALREQAVGGENLLVAGVLQSLANLEFRAGDHALARTYYERVLATRLAVLGPEHPWTAVSMLNLAALEFSTGGYARARSLLQSALQVRQRALGEDAPQTLDVLLNLANVDWAEGHYDRAEATLRRIVEARERISGREHPDTAAALHNLAAVLAERGDHAAARPILERAIAIYERAIGPERFEIAASLANLGDILREAGELDAARATFERALAVWHDAQMDDHIDTAHALVGLARTARLQRRFDEAVSLAERAVAVRERGQAPAEDLAVARLVLGQALTDVDREPARARAAIEAAAAVLREHRPLRTRELAQLDAWFAQHGAAPL